MKFVRWLGAFGKGTSLTEAASWEISQVERQVSAEPLCRGRSFIDHAKIGLAIANPSATFARGWLADAYTTIGEDGIIRRTRRGRSLQSISPRHPTHEKWGGLHTAWKPKEFRNMDKFLAAFSKAKDHDHHAEAAFNAPTYDAVVVKSTATAHGKRRAQRLANRLNLPVRMI